MNKNMLQDVDCIHLCVANLEDGLDFYKGKLGLQLLWKTDAVCGLGTENGSTEVVLSTEDLIIVDLRVDNVENVLGEFIKAGGKLIDGPFDIDIGKCAVVADPGGNKYCLLDMTKGTYDTNSDGSVSGVSKK